MTAVSAGEAAKLKVCLVGDEGVGKTSLIRRFVLSEFDERYVRTLGAVVSKRIVVVPVDGTPHPAALLVWDILGRHDFADRYRDPFFAGASGLLAVADLTRLETLDGLGRWLDLASSVAGDVPAIVLANKADLREHVRIDEDAILAFCELYGAPWLETSARTGENVERAFGTLAEIAVRASLARRPEARAPPAEGVTPNPQARTHL